MWVAFANAKATHIFLAKILAYMLYLMIKVVMVTLANNIVSFEQLGPEVYIDMLLLIYLDLTLPEIYLRLSFSSSFGPQ